MATRKVAPDATPATPTPAEEYAARVEALHVAFLNTPRQSDAARLLHTPGKTFRDNTRRAGHYVSKGSVWPNGAFRTYAPDDATPDAERDARTLAEAMWETPYVQRAVVALLGAPPA